MNEKPKHAGGRPPKFSSVEELEQKIAAFFAECDPHMVESAQWEILRDNKGIKIKDENGYDELGLITRKRMTQQIPYTITGLALALDTTRETLLDYEYKDEYSDTIKVAKQKCQNYNEKRLYDSNPVGVIFNLKNNYKWRDRSEIEQTGEVTHKYEDMTDDQLEAALKARKDRVS